jgi:hypothetical protein
MPLRSCRLEPTVALGDDLATLRITSMPTYGAMRRAGDQPSHLSDRALSSIAPRSKHFPSGDDGGAAAVTTVQRHWRARLWERSGPFSFQYSEPSTPHAEPALANAVTPCVLSAD